MIGGGWCRRSTWGRLPVRSWVGLNELDQEPPGASGVEEGDLVATGSEARSFIDELQPLLLQAGQGFREIRDPVGDVMEALAPTLQETPHRGVGAQGLDELDGPDKEDPDTLGRKLLHRGTGVPGHELEQGTSLLEGGDGHGDVVQRIRKHVFFGAWVRANRTPEGA
jgi:hypothetical protein